MNRDGQVSHSSPTWRLSSLLNMEFHLSNQDIVNNTAYTLTSRRLWLSYLAYLFGFSFVPNPSRYSVCPFINPPSSSCMYVYIKVQSITTISFPSLIGATLQSKIIKQVVPGTGYIGLSSVAPSATNHQKGVTPSVSESMTFLRTDT